MDVEVRRIQANEWREYRELRLEALKDSPLAFVEQYDESLAQPGSFWQDRVRRAATSETVSMFVAVSGETFVGKATCLIEPEVVDHVSAHIVGVYVTPPFRGRDRGVAASVVTAAIRWAREDAGADRVRLFVLDANDRARAFYRQLGFVLTGATMAYPPDPSYVEQEMEYRGGPT